MFDSNSIREGMEVFGSCGNRLGTVDRVEAGSIKLRRNDPEAGGEHHFVPLDWVDGVDQAVRLAKDCGAAKSEWSAAPVGAGAG